MQDRGDMVYSLMGLAIADGHWDGFMQSQWLLQHYPDADYWEVCCALASVGYLAKYQCPQTQQWQWKLSSKLTSDADRIMASAVSQAEAVCMPFQSVEPWKYGETHNHLNIRLTGGSSVPSEAAVEAVNQLQSVQFEINPYITWLLRTNANINKDSMLAAQYRLAEKVQSLGSCRFYVTFDYRFRMYYRGGLLTPQGPDWQKALFQFHVPMRLGNSGLDALRLSAATAYGMKGSLASRLSWGMNQAVTYGEELLNTGVLIDCADPYQFAAIAIELANIRKYIKNGGKDSDYLSKVVCHADGSCNGLQHGAAITGSREVATLTNCTKATRYDAPQDAYSAASTAMVDMLSGSPSAQAAVVAAGRKGFKAPVMTVSYGAGEKTCYIGFTKQLDDAGNSAVSRACNNKAEATVYAAVATVASPIMQLNAVMKKAVTETQQYGPVPVMWESADGCVVIQESKTKNKKLMSWVGTGEYKTRTDGINAKAQEASIGPNMIHTYDADHCREVVRSVGYSLVTVHDSIGCHAGSFWNCASVIRKAFSKVHQYDMFHSFDQCNGTKVEVPNLGDFDPSEVLAAPYFFL
jgi:DNA-directed RNA polymerase